MNYASDYLTERQMYSLNLVGDILIGEPTSHIFSKSECIKKVDKFLKHMTQNDLDALKILLSIFYFIPQSILVIFLKITASHRIFPEPLGKLFRLIHLGPRVIVISLYYSQANILSDIGYNVRVYKSTIGLGK